VTLQPLSDAQIQAYLSETPDLWAALEADAALREMARTPLLMSLFAFAYRDQGAEAAQLRDLRNSPGDLRDAIFEQYVKRRYAHERRKRPTERLPFTREKIDSVLGGAAVKIVTTWWRGENVLPPEYFGLDDQRRPIFIELAVRLHLLVRGEGDTFRFIHLRLCDYFGFRYALPRLLILA